MARIRWHGQSYSATPVRQFDDGDWLVTVNQHGPRFAAGTEIRVRPDEIIEMAAAETPASPEHGLAELNRSMAEERKTLPSVTEVLDRVMAEQVLQGIEDAQKKRAEQEGSEPGPT